MDDIIQDIIDNWRNSAWGTNPEGTINELFAELHVEAGRTMVTCKNLAGKQMTDKRRETVNEHLAKLVHHTCLLYYHLGGDASIFTNEKLEEFSEELDIDYHAVPVLALNMFIGNLVDIMEYYFDLSDDEDDEDAPPLSSIVETLAEVLGSEALAGEDDDDFDQDVPDYLEPNRFAAMLCACMMVALEMDTDFGPIMINAQHYKLKAPRP